MNISSKCLNLIPQKIAFNATAKRGYDILFLLCFSCTFFERAFQLRLKFRCSSIIINISSAFVGSCKSKKKYTYRHTHTDTHELCGNMKRFRWKKYEKEETHCRPDENNKIEKNRSQRERERAIQNKIVTKVVFLFRFG